MSVTETKAPCPGHRAFYDSELGVTVSETGLTQEKAERDFAMHRSLVAARAKGISFLEWEKTYT